MPEDYVKRSDVHKAFQPKYAPAINRTFAAMIDSVPAADVVEVVRCGECKHYRSWGRVYERKDYTGLCTEWSNMSVHKTEFCSRAIRERKDGGQAK